MSKNNDVIVQSPHDFATLVTQLMTATTVLHASQTDIDYVLQGVWNPGLTCRPLPNLLVRQVHAAEYSL